MAIFCVSAHNLFVRLAVELALVEAVDMLLQFPLDMTDYVPDVRAIAAMEQRIW